MTSRLVLVLCVFATVASCGRVAESRFNPLNWFGRSERAEVVTNTRVPGQNLVTQVISLRAESVPGGAILRATGLPPRQGFFNGSLVPVGREAANNGVLLYEFQINAPPRETRTGTPVSREVIVARFLSEQTLAGVRQIRVSGSSNALSVRR